MPIKKITKNIRGLNMRPLIRLFFRTLRAILGPILLLGDKISEPKPIRRPKKEQQRLNQFTKSMSLYHYQACPFCIKVRRTIKRLALSIETIDTRQDTSQRDALLNGGGQIKVPCLRIDNDNGTTTWMYESSDIVNYLQKRFDANIAYE